MRRESMYMILHACAEIELLGGKVRKARGHAPSPPAKDRDLDRDVTCMMGGNIRDGTDIAFLLIPSSIL